VGAYFLPLAAYIAYESALDLWSRRAPLNTALPELSWRVFPRSSCRFSREPRERWGEFVEYCWCISGQMIDDLKEQEGVHGICGLGTCGDRTVLIGFTT
jgi:hypothetical protein